MKGSKEVSLLELKINLISEAQKQGFNLKDLANILDMSQHTIYKFSSKGKITLTNLAKIAYILDCHIDDIVKLKEGPKNKLEDRLWEYTDSKEGDG